MSDFNFELIYAYSRQEAIEDGLQVCVSEQFPHDTRVFKYPVYFTHEVWNLCQEQGIIIWDICYMASLASKAHQTDSSVIQFSVLVQGAERQPDFLEDGLPCYLLLAECGAKDIDDPAPSITIMFPDER
jgi:hypothetical protein